MKDFFYRCLLVLEKRFGSWIFLLIAWHVATGYFLIFPRRVAISICFYHRLFPERGRLARSGPMLRAQMSNVSSSG